MSGSGDMAIPCDFGPQNFKRQGPPQYDVIIEKKLGCKLFTQNTTYRDPRHFEIQEW